MKNGNLLIRCNSLLDNLSFNLKTKMTSTMIKVCSNNHSFSIKILSILFKITIRTSNSQPSIKDNSHFLKLEKREKLLVTAWWMNFIHFRTSNLKIWFSRLICIFSSYIKFCCKMISLWLQSLIKLSKLIKNISKKMTKNKYVRHRKLLNPLNIVFAIFYMISSVEKNKYFQG